MQACPGYKRAQLVLNGRRSVSLRRVWSRDGELTHGGPFFHAMFYCSPDWMEPCRMGLTFTPAPQVGFGASSRVGHGHETQPTACPG